MSFKAYFSLKSISLEKRISSFHLEAMLRLSVLSNDLEFFFLLLARFLLLVCKYNFSLTSTCYSSLFVRISKIVLFYLPMTLLIILQHVLMLHLWGYKALSHCVERSITVSSRVTSCPVVAINCPEPGQFRDHSAYQ